MITELLLFMLTTLIAYLYCSYWRNVKTFTEKGLKVVPGIPLFGNFWRSTLLRRHLMDDIHECYNAFPDERYVVMFERTTSAILIRDPDLVKQVTVRNFDHFVDRGSFLGQEADSLLSNNLSALTGEKWRQMRAALSPAFTGIKIRHMFSFMDAISLNVVCYLQMKINENGGSISEETDVDDLMRRYASDVIASAIFGLELNSVEDKNNKFYEIGQSFSYFSTWQRLSLVLCSLLPNLAKMLNIKIFPDETLDFFRKMLKSTMEQRKKNNIVRSDMVQLLMEAAKGSLKSETNASDDLGFATVEESEWKNDNTKKQWSHDDLTAQAFVFFLAGYETSSSVLVMATHELALHQDVQCRLYEELKTANDASGALTFDTVREMKYLDMVISETLRKWTPALFLKRVCTKACLLPPPRPGAEPYTVQPGQTVQTPVTSIQMDENYYPGSERFDPERFSEENKKNILPFTYMPFGVGPRNCIGSRFALLELKVLLCRLILNFEILKCSKTTEPLRLQATDFQIKAYGGTWVKLRRRD